MNAIPTAEGQTADRRRSVRQRTLRGAVVVFNSRNSVASGIVRNLSEGGAKFVVEYPMHLPHEVSLRLSAEDERAAQVAWQKGGLEFGLQFIEKHASA